MAIDKPLLTRRRVLAALVETTTGVAMALTALSASMIVLNPKIKGTIPTEKRQGLVTFDQFPPVPGTRKGGLTFQTELMGAGVPAAPVFTTGGTAFPVNTSVRLTYVSTAGETTAGASTVVPNPNTPGYSGVTSPAAIPGVTEYRIYAGAAGAETLQATEAIGTNWPLPVGGLIVGVAPPAANTAALIPYWATVLLPGAGMQPLGGSPNTFAPLTGNATTLTLGLYQDGRLYTLSGAVGSVKIMAEVGKPILLEWDFEGIWNPPTSAAILAPSFPQQQPLPFMGAALTIGGNPYKISKAEIDIKNTLAPRQDPNAVSGFHSFFITDRETSAKLDPEALALATQDWYAAHLAGTNFVFSLLLGSAGGNTKTIACPRLVPSAAPTDGDRVGIVTDELEFQATGVLGDDSITLSFA